MNTEYPHQGLRFQVIWQHIYHQCHFHYQYFQGYLCEPRVWTSHRRLHFQVTTRTNMKDYRPIKVWTPQRRLCFPLWPHNLIPQMSTTRSVISRLQVWASYNSLLDTFCFDPKNSRRQILLVWMQTLDSGYSDYAYLSATTNVITSDQLVYAQSSFSPIWCG